MIYRYPKEISDFIKNNVEGRTTKELVEIVNAEFGPIFTESKMKSYKTNHKLKSGTPTGVPAGRPTDLYPEEIRNFIKENHTGIGPKDMAELLNKTFNTNYTRTQMKAFYGNHKINSGVDGRYLPGHTPFNKGKKGVGGWEPTQFKKGHRPHNYMPVGSERVNGDDYVDIKIADPNKWRGKHILIWEEHNGPVPRGHAIIFGDRNNRNFDPDNLICVSKGQLATLNRKGLIRDDADLTRVGVVITDLHQAISKKLKKQGG